MDNGRWPLRSLALPSKPGRGRAVTPGWLQGWSRAGNLDPWQGCSSAGLPFSRTSPVGPCLLVAPASYGPDVSQEVASAPPGSTLGHQSPQGVGSLRVPLFRGVCVAIRCPAVPLVRGAGSCLCLEPATATAGAGITSGPEYRAVELRHLLLSPASPRPSPHTSLRRVGVWSTASAGTYRACPTCTLGHQGPPCPPGPLHSGVGLLPAGPPRPDPW